LIAALSALDDPAVIAEARRRHRAAERDPAATPASIRRAVVRAVGRHADPAIWDELHRKAEGAGSPLEQRLYRDALAGARDPALAQRALEYAVGDAVPAQYAPGLVQGVAAEHPELAWRFYLANSERVSRGLDPLRRYSFGPGLAAATRDPAQLQAWAERNVPAGSRQAVDQGVAAMRAEAEVVGRVLPEVERWLQARASKAA
jgi:aminopeptidase N